MNYNLISLEIAVVVLGLGLLLIDLWTPAEKKRALGWVAAGGLVLIFAGSFLMPEPGEAFRGMYVLDGFAMFFKRFFLLAAILVMVMSVDFADRIAAGIAEYYVLLLFALSGMMFAASANDFTLLFVSLELITVTFYILNSFQRGRHRSLEAGVKYLILGALSSAITVYGIALIYGSTGQMNFTRLAAVAAQFSGNRVFLFGYFMVLVGLGFKISAFPAQMWAPDVYQGAPAPSAAFLAVGSKAAGFALLLRVFFVAAPDIATHWAALWVAIAIVTILYGNLCAIPQRNIKRLMGYSSIANAGYLLIGVAALNADGKSAILYYLAGYLFAVTAVFMIVSIITRRLEGEDVSVLAGLNQRSPLLAAALTLSMVSLAGIPPLAGFFGKFLLVRAAIERGVEASNPAYWWLVGALILGAVISLYYYLGVVRAIYWSKNAEDLSPIEVSPIMKVSIYACMAGMLYLGIFPGPVVDLTTKAVAVLK